MKLSVAAFVALVASGVSAQIVTINTPFNVVECQPSLITWSGGTPPYFLTVEPGGQPQAPELQDLGTQQGTSFSWVVPFAAGQSLGLTIKDSVGNIGQTAPFTVGAGSNTACVGSTALPTSTGSGSSSSSSSGSSSASSTSSSTTTLPATTSSSSTSGLPSSTTPSSSATSAPSSSSTSSKPATSSSSSSSTSAPASTTSSGAASLNAANAGVAGFLGAVAVVLAL
ncbi:hypothetical protein SISNIDRAFT_455747 [Sistotremastrum niveocremeum HHB9708]|uniref:Uncharacterized protein n=2 Tax=Sistotremastraceae TaxID=3402574 RepID=A0A164TP15_9AGAM|nr:hypothetical protein SISNIDRAFT_455747 [Sistotremastrum niveocremeum HHB9708]KZT42187.1 hypothetical protein SISSUDRAFT_1041818 [Sistotremastrum suecicum HHB10207 ss-3]